MATSSDASLPLCPICQGKMSRARLKVPGFGNYVLVEPFATSEEKSNSICLEVWMCTVCGHVDLYAHGEMGESWQRAPDTP